MRSTCANKETQNEFFGSKARADLFRKEVERGADPQETLARMLKGPRDDKTWRPVDSPLAALRKRQPAPKPTPKPAPVVKRKERLSLRLRKPRRRQLT